MTNTPGHLQERPLIEELKLAIEENNTYTSYEDYHYCVIAVLDVLRARGLINEQGLEIIKREME